MNRISLEGRVAVVTGAGRGLGKAYAEYLAARGAAVVVNDLGTDGTGNGSDGTVADEVAAAIRSAGHRAVGCGQSVATVEGGQAIIDLAVQTFGRIDIVITNAGICSSMPFSKTTLEDFRQYWDIHVGGTINVVKPAWEHMAAQKYGRIVMIESSAGLFGLEGQASYAAAKGAIHGLMRTLALEGQPDNICVNAVLPGGYSRMTEAALDDEKMLAWMRQWMRPELVAPLVVWLSSDACTATGEAFSAWSGRVAKIVLGTGQGFYDGALTPESIAENYATIASDTGLFEPRRNLDEVANWLKLGLVPTIA